MAGTFGTAGVAIAYTTVAFIAQAGLAAGVVWGATELYHKFDQDRRYNNAIAEANEVEGQQKPGKTDGKKRPQYCGQELGKDPTKSPGNGFQWKGKGTPDTGKGSWVKDWKMPTEEKLHPDINHPPPKGAHWDYEGIDGKARLYTDGTFEWK